MEQIVLLSNPCFPLVLLSGFPPPFHLPVVLVKPGPERHLLSVMGSGTQPGRPGVGSPPPVLNLYRVGEWVSGSDPRLCASDHVPSCKRTAPVAVTGPVLWDSQGQRRKRVMWHHPARPVSTPCRTAWPATSAHRASISPGHNYSRFAKWSGESACACPANGRRFINVCLLSRPRGELPTGDEHLGES